MTSIRRKLLLTLLGALLAAGFTTAAATFFSAQAEFNERWKAIGFVRFKEKDAITREFREAMHAAFPPAASPVNRKNDLIRRYNALQQDIVTYENNIGFFSNSKGSSALVAQMQQRIESAKAELKALEEQIRKEESQA